MKKLRFVLLIWGGLMIHIGIYGQNGIDKETQIAMEKFTGLYDIRKLAEKGDPLAMTELGKIYLRSDTLEAKKLFEKAAQKNETEAMYFLGNILCHQQQFEEAGRWMKKSAEGGEVKAMVCIGLFYEDGIGVLQDYENAFNWYKKAADKGNVEAMYYIGQYYEKGIVDRVNIEEASKWYTKAADLGYVEAIVSLGDLYDEAEKVSDAEKWYIRAAELGDANAMIRCGMYCSEKGQFDMAHKWYEKSAAKGNSDALTLMGKMYAEGKGVPQNKEKAYELYLSAYKRGSLVSSMLLGIMSYEKKDYPHAFKYLSEAADNHSLVFPDAMRMLAACYRYGLGTSVDPAKEKYWMEKAAEHKNEKAIRILDSVIR